MKIAICDDDTLQLKLLNKYCSDWFLENKLHAKISIYSSAEAFLFSYEDDKNYDVLLLDIQMKDLSGIDLAKKLRSLGDDILIIFITGIKDFVFEGYHVQAVDYILKPIDEQMLKKALKSAVERIDKRDIYLIIQQDNEVKKIKEKDICYIESSAHSTYIYTINNRYEVKRGISSLEKELIQNFFYKCHRSYIINILHITSISKNEVRINDLCIPIARGKWEELNKAFLNYYRGELC